MEITQVKRNTNFSMEEIEILVDCVKQFKHIIENKKTNAVTSKLKKAAWEEIRDVFNSISTNGFRDEKTLKNKYENLKKTTKKKFSLEKETFRLTGGGQGETIKIDPVEAKVRDLVGKQLDGMPSEFDNDADSTHTDVETIHVVYDSSSCEDDNCKDDSCLEDPAPIIPEEQFVETIVTPNKGLSNDWDVLRKRKSAALVTSNKKKAKAKNVSNEAWTELARKKIDLVDLQMKHAQAEHDLKMELMRKESDMKMKELELDIEFKKRKMISFV